MLILLLLRIGLDEDQKDVLLGWQQDMIERASKERTCRSRLMPIRPARIWKGLLKEVVPRLATETKKPRQIPVGLKQAG